MWVGLQVESCLLDQRGKGQEEGGLAPLEGGGLMGGSERPGGGMKGMWEGRWVEVWARFLAQVTGRKVGTGEKQQMWKPFNPGQGEHGQRGRRPLPLASSSSADLAPCFLLGFTSFVQMAPLSLL